MDQQPSSMGTVAMVLGIVGLAMTVFSCCFSMLLIPGGLLSGIGLVLGFLELQKINQGTVSEAGRGPAMAGVATGGTGCLLSVLWCLGISLFMVLYVGLIFVSILAGGLQ